VANKPHHLGKSPLLEAKFWALVDKTPGLGSSGTCWEWRGGVIDRQREGGRYGRFHVSGVYYFAPRVALEWSLGRHLRDGYQPDHICRHPPCVRSGPEHLEEVTLRTNVLRGTSPPAVNAKKLVCPKCRSHFTKKRGFRRCQVCADRRVVAKRAHINALQRTNYARRMKEGRPSPSSTHGAKRNYYLAHKQRTSR
jgi:hypothetical protein